MRLNRHGRRSQEAIARNKKVDDRKYRIAMNIEDGKKTKRDKEAKKINWAKRK